MFEEPNDDNLVPGISAQDLAALEEERETYQETEVQMAQRLLLNALVGAVSSMTKLALHSSNERTRMAAAQYVIERSMGRIQDNPPEPVDDPIARLLADVVVAVPELAAAAVSDAKGKKNESEDGS